MKPQSIFTTYRYYLGAIILAFILVACNQENVPKDILTEEDKKFVLEAAYDLEAMRRMTNLASFQAHNEIVKFYAQQTAPELSAHQLELKRIAYLEELSYPEEPRPQNQQLYQELAGMHGFKFDSIFIQEQVKLHTEKKESYHNYVNNGRYSSLRAFAIKNLPKINKRLERAQQIKNALKY